MWFLWILPFEDYSLNFEDYSPSCGPVPQVGQGDYFVVTCDLRVELHLFTNYVDNSLVISTINIALISKISHVVTLDAMQEIHNFMASGKKSAGVVYLG